MSLEYPGTFWIMSKKFLKFTKKQKNNLYSVVKPGDKWCLCISTWLQAEKVGKAPFVILEATHIKSLQFTSLEKLKQYS